MNAAETMIWLSNTAHQREVADLQAAGLNPVLSANSSGAAVPNIQQGTSAKAISAAGKANPLNKALDIIDKHYNDRADWDKANSVIEQFPEGAGSAYARYGQESSSSSSAGDAVQRMMLSGLTHGQATAAYAAEHAPIRLSARQGAQILNVLARAVGARGVSNVTSALSSLLR